jgi:hypothetical protein
MRYLVTEEDGTGHLPVRDSDDGALNHHLMGAAWAALHGGYRGNKYQGPDKEKAIAKLKALYKSEGMPLPSESAGETGNGGKGEKAHFPVSPFPHLTVYTSRLAIALAEPILRDGKSFYEHPVCVTGSWVKDGRHFSITRQDLADMVKNLEKRGNHQVPFDYEHASEQPEVAKGGPVPAAGWVHALSLTPTLSQSLTPGPSPDGRGENRRVGEGATTLYALVEWTPDAVEMIKKDQYRFVSPAIDWSYADKETGKPQGATLTSCALTNHPFLDALPALQLTDRDLDPGRAAHGQKTADRGHQADVSTGYLDAPLKQISVAYGGKKMATNKLSMKCAEDGAHQVFDGDEMLGEIPHKHLCEYARTHLADDLGIPDDNAGVTKGQAGIPGHQAPDGRMSELLKESGARSKKQRLRSRFSIC